MGAVAQWLEYLDRFGVYLAAVGLTVLFVMVFSEVVLRQLFQESFLYADEVGGYLYPFVAYLALGYTLRTGGHISVTLLSNRFPKKSRRWIELAVSLAALLMVSFIILWVMQVVIGNYQTGLTADSRLRTPRWIPQSAMLLGLVIFGFAYVARILRLLRDEYKPDLESAASSPEAAALAFGETASPVDKGAQS